VLVAETYVQGPKAARAVEAALADLCARGVEVLVIARGGGSFDDLLPFSDERLVRAVCACSVPVVSAIGHEQDVCLVDLAADVRASTPSVAGRLVVPDLAELRAWLERAQLGLRRSTSRVCARRAERLALTRERLRRAPLRELERRAARLASTRTHLQALSPAATVERGYAIVRAGGRIVREPPAAGTELEVEVAGGPFGARAR
jgi:exodeoxyribonuclease VII large subunit